MEKSKNNKIGAFLMVALLSVTINAVALPDEQNCHLDSTSGSDPPNRCGCFRGKPLPECCTFWIFEAGVYHGLTEGSQLKDLGIDNIGTADIGPMHNLELTISDRVLFHHFWQISEIPALLTGGSASIKVSH